MATVVEQIWQGTIGGYFAGLNKANEYAKQNDWLAYSVQCATTNYSYGLIRAARRWADLTARLAWDKMDSLTHGQCDIIGTILLWRFFWIKPDVLSAKGFLLAGLGKNPPWHSQSLLLIGLAEASFLEGDLTRCQEYMKVALGLREQVQNEKDPVQAMRQFVRVLRRAMVLEAKLGNKDVARTLYCEALGLVRDPVNGSKSQRKKLNRAWKRIDKPRFWHCWYN